MDNLPPLPPPPPPQAVDSNTTATTTTNNNQSGALNSTHAMENFKALVFKLALASTRTSSLGPAQTLLLEQRLNDFFDNFHTPDHPPYSAMIHNAVQQLRDERGSSEQKISEIIKENCNDLPWAHDTLLKHHLRELCRSGDIIETRDGCYLLGDEGTRISPISSPSPLTSSVASPSCSLSSSCTSSCSSISRSSSSSSFDRGCWLKKRRLNLKGEGPRREKGRQRERRLEGKETCGQLTKESARRRSKPSQKDVTRKKNLIDAKQLEATEKGEIGLTDNEDEYQLKEKNEFHQEQHQVESEECGNDEHCEKDKTKNSEPHEQEDQANKKPGRRKRRAHRNSVKEMTWEPGRERGRRRRKLMFTEMQAFMEDTDATKVGDSIIGDKTDAAEEEDQPFATTEQHNQAIEEQKEVLGKPFATEQNQAEGTDNFIGIVPQFCEVEDVNELVKRKKQGVVLSGDGSNDVISEIYHLTQVYEVTEEQNNLLLLQQKVTAEKCQQEGQEAGKAKQQDILMEEQIDETCEHNFPEAAHEVPKRKRGRRPKASGRGKEIQRKHSRVPGRGRGRPRKIVLSEGNQRTVEQIAASESHHLNMEEIVVITDEEDEPMQEQNWADGDEGQVQGKQLDISEQKKEVCTVHNQPKANDDRIEPGEHPVEVIDKQGQLQEQDDVICQPNFLADTDILDEFNKWMESKM